MPLRVVASRLLTAVCGSSHYAAAPFPSAGTKSSAETNIGDCMGRNEHEAGKGSSGRGYRAKAEGLSDGGKKGRDQTNPAARPLLGRQRDAHLLEVLRFPLDSPLSSKRSDVPWHPVLACAANRLASFNATVEHAADNLSNVFDDRHYTSHLSKHDFNAAEFHSFVGSFVFYRFSLREIITAFILFQRSLPGISKVNVQFAWRRLFVACLVQADELVNGSRPEEYYSVLWLQVTNKSLGTLDNLSLLLSELNSAVLSQNTVVETADINLWCTDLQRDYLGNFSKRIEFPSKEM